MRTRRGGGAFLALLPIVAEEGEEAGRTAVAEGAATVSTSSRTTVAAGVQAHAPTSACAHVQSPSGPPVATLEAVPWGQGPAAEASSGCLLSADVCGLAADALVTVRARRLRHSACFSAARLRRSARAWSALCTALALPSPGDGGGSGWLWQIVPAIELPAASRVRKGPRHEGCCAWVVGPTIVCPAAPAWT